MMTCSSVINSYVDVNKKLLTHTLVFVGLMIPDLALGAGTSGLIPGVTLGGGAAKLDQSVRNCATPPLLHQATSTTACLGWLTTEIHVIKETSTGPSQVFNSVWTRTPSWIDDPR